MLTKTIPVLFALLTVFGIASRSQAATISAASCSQVDVQVAVNKAVSGDTIMVPAGNCTWITLSTTTPSVHILGKNITLKGSGIDKTVITDATNGNWKETALWVEGSPAKITGFTFVNNTNANTGSYFVVRMESTGGDGANGFRIFNNKFLVDYKYAISTRGLSYGLIDHNTFITKEYHTLIAADLDGLTSWSRPSSLGTADAIYIEDNQFTYSSTTQRQADKRAVYSQRGSRYVFRHNTVTNLSVDMHGHCGDVSTFGYEVYDNDFVVESGYYMDRWMFVRGGSGVIFNNQLTSSGIINRKIDLSEYRLSAINSCANEQKNCCTQYPCFGQIGRSTNQQLDPLYIWNNKINGTEAAVTVNQVYEYNTLSDGTKVGVCGNDPPSISEYIILNRDYYVGQVKPGYIPYRYPHPLQGGEPVDTTAPAAPAGLRVE